jgi:hypothetical protein
MKCVLQVTLLFDEAIAGNTPENFAHCVRKALVLSQHGTAPYPKRLIDYNVEVADVKVVANG